MKNNNQSVDNYIENKNLCENIKFIYNVKYHRDTKKADAVFWKSTVSNGKLVGRDISLPDRSGFVGFVNLSKTNTKPQKFQLASNQKLVEPSGLSIIKSIDSKNIYVILGAKYNMFHATLDIPNKCIKLNKRTNNAFFKSIHHLDRLKNKLLVTSTGFDTLIEIDINQSVQTWIWHAWENGYTQSPSLWHITSNRSRQRKLLQEGKNVIYMDKKQPESLRKLIPTPRQTTHINSAIYKNSETILATLFHQGDLVEINKNTGISKPVFRDMKNPHFISKLILNNKQHFIVTDTVRGTCNILDKSLRLKLKVDFTQQLEKYKKNYYWLQSVCPIANNIVVGVDGVSHKFIVVDLLNHQFRVVKFSDYWYVHAVFPLT